MEKKGTWYLVCNLIIYFALNMFTACSKNNEGPVSPDQTNEIDDKNTFFIIQGGIADHSDANIFYSIAWYFKTYGASKTYVLATSGTHYRVNNTLTIPSNSIFKGNDSIGDYTIIASTGVDKKTMVAVGSGCKLEFLTIDGNREAGAVVNASGTTGTVFKNCKIQNSKNDYLDSDGEVYTILINGNNSSNLMIDACELNNAGANPKENPTTNSSKGYGVMLWSSSNSTVQNSSINFTSTCGIDITGAAKVDIIGNSISQTGLNRNLAGPIADAITGYHNWKTTNEDFYLSGNTIRNANNHGIHVSGKNITILNNTIVNQQLSGIMVDDWRTTAPGNEYSENIVIKNNQCSDPLSWVWQPGNSNRKIYVDRVNSSLNLDYQINHDQNGAVLPVTALHYHIPTIFGIHQ